MSTQTRQQTRLEALVESFDRDTAEGRERIRGLMDNDPRAFQEGIVPVLRSGSSPRGIQFAVGLLVGSPCLFGALCNPALTCEEGIMLARTALQADGAADVVLAKRLVEDASSSRLSSSTASRLMEILDKISNGRRLMPFLLRLMRLSDPQIRSKAALMIGRGNFSVQWLRKVLGDPDPRIRASGIESLWGHDARKVLDVREVCDMLRSAAKDVNNRIAANALLALYGMGESWSIPELVKMSANEAPMFRASAAWVMGETGDRRFAETLLHMMSDANAIVRKRTFSALGRIRKATAQAHSGREWRVCARLLPAIDGKRQIAFETRPKEGSALPELVATQFRLTEGKRVVDCYQVEERPAPEIVSISFLLPHAVDLAMAPWAQGILKSLASKRPSDLWRVLYFTRGAIVRGPAVEVPPFTSDAKTAAAALEKPPESAQCPNFWSALRNSVRAGNAQARGPRHLIVYCPEDPGVPPDLPEIASAASSSQVNVHAIAGASHEPLENLCHSTRGVFHVAAPGEDVVHLLEEPYLMLLPRFTIVYQPVSANAESLHIWVANAAGWGETTISLTG